MLKPLGEKSLEKKYSELGLSKEKQNTLRIYFQSFANLYGVIPVNIAWDIFKQYEGSSYLRKKDFVSFAAVAQRDGTLPYYIVDIDELYTDEKPSPEWRFIVHKSLIFGGYNKYRGIYRLENTRDKYAPFVPDKNKFLSFSEDVFYKTEAGKKFSGFICSLKSSGTGTDYVDNKYELLDTDGQSTKDRRLDSFIFITRDEQFNINYYKNENKKKFLSQEYTKTAADKFLTSVKRGILEGDFSADYPEMDYSIKQLNKDFGVLFTPKEFEKYVSLYTDLHNSSNMWCMYGWSPLEIVAQKGIHRPEVISLGPNIKEQIERGEFDVEDFEKRLAQMGIKLIK